MDRMLICPNRFKCESDPNCAHRIPHLEFNQCTFLECGELGSTAKCIPATSYNDIEIINKLYNQNKGVSND